MGLHGSHNLRTLHRASRTYQRQPCKLHNLVSTPFVILRIIALSRYFVNKHIKPFHTNMHYKCNICGNGLMSKLAFLNHTHGVRRIVPCLPLPVLSLPFRPPLFGPSLIQEFNVSLRGPCERYYPMHRFDSHVWQWDCQIFCPKAPFVDIHLSKSFQTLGIM